VQEFEQMVGIVRMSCILLTSEFTSDGQRLMSIVFHHNSLTAAPLFDIMRALYAELAKEKDLPQPERHTLRSILKQIAKAYGDLVTSRNSLLHGTWFVGWASSEDQDFSELKIDKHKVTAEGLVQVDLPKHVDDLKALAKRAADTNAMLFRLFVAFTQGSSISANFIKNSDGSWSMP
jgi:hypothetical protein